MAKHMEAQQAFSGHDGEVWINGTYCAEIISIKADVSLDKQEVKMVKHKGKGYRITGYTGKGSMKMHKISSWMLKQLNEDIKNGKQSIFTVISKVENANDGQIERIVINDATFDNMPLVDWEVDKLMEESYNFTFSDWEILDAAVVD